MPHEADAKYYTSANDYNFHQNNGCKILAALMQIFDTGPRPEQ
jgi:hypothetical protein